MKKLYCSTCERYFYNGWGTHITTYQHRSNTQQKRIRLKVEDEKRQKECNFIIQLASALEGHTLNPGDEVGLRDGREFKMDIHGTLFEIPVGS
jgi:hypothetical protein